MLANHTNGPSPWEDDEGDEDYIPLPSEGDSSEERYTDGIDTVSPSNPEDLDEKRRRRAKLWANFLATEPPRPPDAPSQKLVKVIKRYRFAGKESEEIIVVPEDSPEADKWPLWHASSSDEDVPMTADPSHEPTNTASQEPTATLDSPPLPPRKRPGPRRGKVTLPGFTVTHSIGRTPSGTGRTDHFHGRTVNTHRITTLDKSAIDWRSHVSAQEPVLRDELDANRRGGGYLDRMAFMQRVEQRKEDLLDASRPTGKRRRI
ncbi:hypothetical protein HDZ31DRAFT_74410 [Schizophyllum fasciatum]